MKLVGCGANDRQYKTITAQRFPCQTEFFLIEVVVVVASSMVKKMVMRSLALIVAVAAVTTAYRLPRSVAPERYKVQIESKLGNEKNQFDFDGKVWIHVIILQKTDNITLHSKNLTIDTSEVTVKDKDDKLVEIKKIDFDHQNDFVVVLLSEELKAEAKYEVYIPFKGEMLDTLTGFYKSSYKSGDEKKWLGVTQFEPYHARKAFPCFDEPALKAKFEIVLGHREQYTSISNMPLASSEPYKEEEGWVWDHYEPSVPMSTYLVAYVISDFAFKQSPPSSHNNVTFKVWARKQALNQVDFAGEVGPKALEYFEKFFDIKYPLPKQDMIAVPDFSAGAMENWGLITYREAYLLYDPLISSVSSKHAVASVIAHELAHQWFGNLVTMKWWTDLWLNEGFATYMAGLAVDHMFPQWNSLEAEAVKNLLNVFSFDAMKTSHPVSVTIGNPSEIDEIFDTISYKKGSLLLRMMSLFLGEETLRKGVSNYLKKHKYGNAEQDDLWHSLTEEAHIHHNLPINLTVKTVMDTWTLQTGYPVVTVRRNYETNSAQLSQERFLRDEVKLKDSKACWWVPLTWTTAEKKLFNSTQAREWLACPKEAQTIENLPGNDSWVLFNIQAASIYKINYDEHNWRLLIEQLNESNGHEEIATLNRVQLIDDSSDFAWTGDLSYEIFFDLIAYLKNENGYLPWKAGLRNLNVLNRHLAKSSAYGDYRAFLRDLITPIYKKIGKFEITAEDNGKLDNIKHKVLIIGHACRNQVPDCIEKSQEIFAKWQANPNEESSVPPKDLRDVIYCNAIRHGGEKEWDFLWEQYTKSNVATEKVTMLHSLGCARELWLLSRYLEWSVVSDHGIRKQDIGTVFSAVAGNDVGFYVAKTFLFENLDRIYTYLGSNARRLKVLLTEVASRIISEQDLIEYEQFIKKNERYFKDIKKGVEQSLEQARLNLQWQRKHLANLKALLFAKYKKPNEK